MSEEVSLLLKPLLTKYLRGGLQPPTVDAETSAILCVVLSHDPLLVSDGFISMPGQFTQGSGSFDPVAPDESLRGMLFKPTKFAFLTQDCSEELRTYTLVIDEWEDVPAVSKVAQILKKKVAQSRPTYYSDDPEIAQLIEASKQLLDNPGEEEANGEAHSESMRDGAANVEPNQDNQSQSNHNLDANSEPDHKPTQPEPEHEHEHEHEPEREEEREPAVEVEHEVDPKDNHEQDCKPASTHDNGGATVPEQEAAPNSISATDPAPDPDSNCEPQHEHEVAPEEAAAPTRNPEPVEEMMCQHEDEHKTGNENENSNKIENEKNDENENENDIENHKENDKENGNEIDNEKKNKNKHNKKRYDENQKEQENDDETEHEHEHDNDKDKEKEKAINIEHENENENGKEKKAINESEDEHKKKEVNENEEDHEKNNINEREDECAKKDVNEIEDEHEHEKKDVNENEDEHEKKDIKVNDNNNEMKAINENEVNNGINDVNENEDDHESKAINENEDENKRKDLNESEDDHESKAIHENEDNNEMKDVNENEDEYTKKAINENEDEYTKKEANENEDNNDMKDVNENEDENEKKVINENEEKQNKEKIKENKHEKVCEHDNEREQQQEEDKNETQNQEHDSSNGHAHDQDADDNLNANTESEQNIPLPANSHAGPNIDVSVHSQDNPEVPMPLCEAQGAIPVNQEAVPNNEMNNKHNVHTSPDAPLNEGNEFPDKANRENVAFIEIGSELEEDKQNENSQKEEMGTEQQQVRKAEPNAQPIESANSVAADLDATFTQNADGTVEQAPNQRPEPQAETQSDATPEPQPGIQHDTMSEPIFEAEPNAPLEPHLQPPRLEQHTGVQFEQQTEPRAEAGPEVQQEQQSDTQPDAHPEQKSETGPQIVPTPSNEGGPEGEARQPRETLTVLQPITIPDIEMTLANPNVVKDASSVPAPVPEEKKVDTVQQQGKRPQSKFRLSLPSTLKPKEAEHNGPNKVRADTEHGHTKDKHKEKQREKERQREKEKSREKDKSKDRDREKKREREDGSKKDRDEKGKGKDKDKDKDKDKKQSKDGKKSDAKKQDGKKSEGSKSQSEDNKQGKGKEEQEGQKKKPKAKEILFRLERDEPEQENARPASTISQPAIQDLFIQGTQRPTTLTVLQPHEELSNDTKQLLENSYSTLLLEDKAKSMPIHTSASALPHGVSGPHSSAGASPPNLKLSSVLAGAPCLGTASNVRAPAGQAESSNAAEGSGQEQTKLKDIINQTMPEEGMGEDLASEDLLNILNSDNMFPALVTLEERIMQAFTNPAPRIFKILQVREKSSEGGHGSGIGEGKQYQQCQINIVTPKVFVSTAVGTDPGDTAETLQNSKGGSANGGVELTSTLAKELEKEREYKVSRDKLLNMLQDIDQLATKENEKLHIVAENEKLQLRKFAVELCPVDERTAQIRKIPRGLKLSEEELRLFVQWRDVYKELVSTAYSIHKIPTRGGRYKDPRVGIKKVLHSHKRHLNAGEETSSRLIRRSRTSLVDISPPTKIAKT